MSTPPLEGHPRFWAVAGLPLTPAVVVAGCLGVTTALVLVVRRRRRG